jgi:GT2 family glycosyltransferase
MKQTKLPPVQAGPLKVPQPGGGQPGMVKVDTAFVGDGLAIVAGWRIGPVDVELDVDGLPVAAEILSFVRTDVAEQFNLESDAVTGFALVARNVAAGALRLVAGAAAARGSADQRHVLSTTGAESLGSAERAALGPAGAALAGRYAVGSDAWRQLVERVPNKPLPSDCAIGHVDASACLHGTGQIIVLGWVTASPGVQVWLEDDAGQAVGLEHAYRFHRRDVFDLLAGGPFFGAAAEAAFLTRFESRKPVGRVRLMALGPQGRHVVSEAACADLPRSPDVVVRWLFGANTPRDDLARRFALVDRPLLEAIAARNADLWATLPVQRIDYGTPPARPRASLIVPLYGRFDFVEDQMVEWVRDPAIGRTVELVYVVDDPAIINAFMDEAAALHRLYGVSFRVVHGGANRGFSGANNLGAAESRGDVLVFLNSDAFPRGPGWVESLCAVLEQHPDIGAVGPRLLFADGGIQHAGMRFEWLQEFGIWANLHPGSGLDPALDPARGLTDVPAVTGACLAVRRGHFERVGGWDTGYVIGDFEDSDLCLKLRSRGLRVVYDPSVELTHLERQSFALLGGGEFRQQVVLLNAHRHQHRWAALLAQGGGAT